MSDAMQDLEDGPLHRFQDWPNEEVPKRTAGVCTVWDGERLLYVGMSGRAVTAEDLEVSDGGRVVAKGVWTRLNTMHLVAGLATSSVCTSVTASCAGTYPSQQQQLAAGTRSLDSPIRAFVRERLAYRFVMTVGGTEALKLERDVRRGSLSVGKPYLNPLAS